MVDELKKRRRGAAPASAPACTPALGPHLERVPSRPGHGHPCDRLFHHRHDHTATPLCPLRDRDPSATGAPARRYRQSQWPLGSPGSPQLRFRPRRRGATLPVPHPRPRHQVRRKLRRRVRLHRHREHANASRLAAGTGLRRAVRTDRPSGLPSITFWSWHHGIWRPCSPTTSATTTKPGPIAVSISTHRSPDHPHRSPMAAK